MLAVLSIVFHGRRYFSSPTHPQFAAVSNIRLNLQNKVCSIRVLLRTFTCRNRSPLILLRPGDKTVKRNLRQSFTHLTPIDAFQWLKKKG